MNLKFTVVQSKSQRLVPVPNMAYLVSDNWDDYSFKTLFNLVYFDSKKHEIEFGSVKIGHIGQEHGWTRDRILSPFNKLSSEWFSLGQDVSYYRVAAEDSKDPLRKWILKALRDVAADESILEKAQLEDVFKTSLTRTVSFSAIRGQFRRVLAGQPPLTDFSFDYVDPGSRKRAAVDLQFEVLAESIPPTNIHVLIGRNGVGKTTILNEMSVAIAGVGSTGSFVQDDSALGREPLASNYFSSAISVSFSAFDPFVPPKVQHDRTKGGGYFYVGMKQVESPEGAPKTVSELRQDLTRSIEACLSQPAKRLQWLNALEKLESDENFKEMALGVLADAERDEIRQKAERLALRMSSGHSVVLLVITRLVELVEEKTLVLLDEPESHLHPPLLAAFVRALSELLHSRNAVAIVATHSPVVLQEVPKSCVWKLTRIGAEGRSDRPERETFGENVGILTREVFGLEVSKSGFHEMLQKAVDSGKSHQQILASFKNQLGLEAHSVLQAMITSNAE